MYYVFIALYVCGAHVAACFSKKVRTMLKGQIATWRKLRQNIRPDSRVVWFHAASLGEFEQGRPLMERLRRQRPDAFILLTFFSPSGYEVRKNYAGADLVCYLPFDTHVNAYSFLHLAHPEAAYFIKYEFWKNYLAGLHRRGTPVYSVSSIFRPGQIFFHWWNFGYAKCLKYITHFYVQNEQSRLLLLKAGIGGDRISVSGDTRFDRVVDIQRQARSLTYVEQWKRAEEGPVMVCGSTWPPDEELILPYFNAHPEMRLILAPHVVSEEHLQKIEGQTERPIVRLSQYLMQKKNAEEQAEEGPALPDCLLVDSYGLLSSLYRYGQVAYVGGGFGVGIHNVPEAAVYGVPVIIGPNNGKFQEAQDLIALGGALQIEDADSFSATLDRLIRDEAHRQKAGQAAGHYIHSRTGAADIIARDTMQG